MIVSLVTSHHTSEFMVMDNPAELQPPRPDFVMQLPPVEIWSSWGEIRMRWATWQRGLNGFLSWQMVGKWLDGRVAQLLVAMVGKPPG